MALTGTQLRQLRAKLESKHVKTRNANGTSLHYVEGWHVIAEANRIFGYDAWDRRTLVSRCVWSGPSGSYHAAAYTAKVRVSVRAGDITIVREGSGTGEGTAPTPGQAHELALKGAETDATKRALATFGNPFGLALYDRNKPACAKLETGALRSLRPSTQDHWCCARPRVLPAQAFKRPKILWSVSARQ
jgi:recombination DNA repair RAD52 pathway protein